MRYKDRQGKVYNIDTTQDKFLRLLYRHTTGRMLISILIRPGVTNVMGSVLNKKFTRLKIKSFVKKNGIDLSEYEVTKYKSYNDFFIRKIRPGARPIDPDTNVLVSPSDGKLSLYKISDSLVMTIKNSQYSVKSLILSTELAHEFAGGYCFIIRLTPDDYHRYIFPDSGEIVRHEYIDGVFHTVNPVAMEHANIYYENTREYTIIDTKHFGRMLQMEVGALGVGRIVNSIIEGRAVKGVEKGYFEFGGSTIVLMFKEGVLVPDEDLIRNTQDGFETYVKLGERIAVKA